MTGIRVWFTSKFLGEPKLNRTLYCRKKISNNSFVESNLCMDSECFHYFHCCFAHWRISQKCGSICCHSTAKQQNRTELLKCWIENSSCLHGFEAIQIGLVYHHVSLDSLFSWIFHRKRRIWREKKYKIRGSATISSAFRCDISQKRCAKQPFYRCNSHLNLQPELSKRLYCVR